MKRVLVVDDLAAFRGLVGKLLSDLGHEVVEAENGPVAAEKLRKEHFDLVLLDYQMPMWDGVEAMMLFRRVRHGAKVIAYTSQDPKTSNRFETVMHALGTAAVVRCGEDIRPLLEAAKQVLAVEAKPKPGANGAPERQS